MKRRDQEDLLKEIFADEGLDALREDTLVCGLSVVQTRRRGRTLRLVVLATAPMLLLAAVMLWPKARNLSVVLPPVSVASVSSPRVKFYPATVASDAPPVTPISDEELLDLFGDHPVALLGSAGRQRLVVFDDPQRVVR